MNIEEIITNLPIDNFKCKFGPLTFGRYNIYLNNAACKNLEKIDIDNKLWIWIFIEECDISIADPESLDFLKSQINFKYFCPNYFDDIKKLIIFIEKYSKLEIFK